MTKRVLLSIVCLMAAAVAWCAAPTAGKYYRIVNAVSTGYSLAENYQSNKLVATETSATKDYKQLWYYTGTGLQNVYTGRYVQNQTQQSAQFSTGATSPNLNVMSTTDGHFLLKVEGNVMHCDGSKNIVKWQDEANENSHWTFEEVSLTASEVEAARKEYQAFVKTETEFATLLSNMQKVKTSDLEPFFADKACTKLNATYAAMSDADLKAAITAAGLPEQIANIALKVKNGWTDETDASMSAEFRVQDYGAYAAAGPWRWNSNDGKGLNASQINDMNNPTGIYTTGRDVLFVFVEGTIPTGCELRLSAVDEGITGFGYNNYDNGTVLRQGLNVIGAENDLREYWVMYTVTNKNLKPADQPKVKIHIEGGHVMGYVNYHPEDEAKTNEEYKRILLAANASADASGADKCRLRLATRGEYGMFYFQIMTYNLIWSDCAAKLLKNTPSCTFETEKFDTQYRAGYKIWKSMKFYDDVLHQEYSVMGFLKETAEATSANPIYNCFGGLDLYPTYCNCHCYTIMGTKGGNPHSSTGYTHMPGVGAVESSYNGERSNFDVWCVGHESGHNNQGAINLQSSTESSNNLFSNIITYWYGHRMSRGNTIKDNENDFQNNTQFSLRDISMTMRMYYQLYLYYHTAGHKKDFYPTLFVDLRRDALNLNNGRDSWLKFYQKACRAAQEDLTEFFRFWGFFVAFDTTTFGDYTNRTLSLSQATIDEAIAEIKAEAKANGWRENLEIMFIDDRSQLRERTDIWASSEAGQKDKITGMDMKWKPDNSGNWRTAEQLKASFGELGDVLTYTAGATKGNYSYTVSGDKVEMTGEGGVGFLIYSAEGEIVAHSNSLSFSLPAEIATSDFTIKVINADGSATQCANETGVEQYRLALQNIINDSKSLTSLLDESGTKMGYYTPEQLTALQALVADGQTILANNTEGSYVSQYRAILKEMTRIEAEEIVQKVKKTGVYTVESNRSRGHFLNGSSSLTTSTGKAEQQQWTFIPVVGQSDTYYMQNIKTQAFLAPVISDSKLSGWTVSEKDIDRAGTFTLEQAGSGAFYIKTNNVEKGNYYINCDPSYNIAVWNADAGSKWNIVRVNEIEEFTITDIRNLVAQTNTLVDDISTTDSKNEKLTIQNTDPNAPFYVSTNANDAGVDPAHNLDYLVDGNSSTYFSTVGSTRNAKRFITLNLGEGNEVADMKIYYRTAPNQHTLKPTEMTVKVGDATAKLDTLTILTGLPNNTTKVETYTSPVLSASKPCAVWRFIIDESNNTTETTHPEFALAYMWFYNNFTVITMKEGYEGVNVQLIKDAQSAVEEANAALKGSTTLLDNYYIYIAVKAAYDKLDAAAVPTAIESIEATAPVEPSVKGIFDIHGRRLDRVTKSGLYIIDGKKVMVK